MSKTQSHTKLPWASIDALVLDCDGVLTTGEIFYSAAQERTLAFYARDGLGIATLCRAGIHCGILSGRPVDIAEKRHKELGVEAFIGRSKNKAADIRVLSERFNVPLERMAYIGDDIADLAPVELVGIGVAVADAAEELCTASDFICEKQGGRGAVREVCEHILKAKGLWVDILKGLSAHA